MGNKTFTPRRDTPFLRAASPGRRGAPQLYKVASATVTLRVSPSSPFALDPSWIERARPDKGNDIVNMPTDYCRAAFNISGSNHISNPENPKAARGWQNPAHVVWVDL